MKIYSFSTEGVAKEKYSACESETNSREVNPPICYPCCQSLRLRCKLDLLIVSADGDVRIEKNTIVRATLRTENLQI